MTIKEIAKLAGVSVSTVSKIMNGKDDSIRAETREHVLKIAKEYHYTPYSSVISSNIKSLTIGVILRNTSDITMTMTGILEAAGELGYSVIMCESKNSPKIELKNISLLFSKKVDGILWEPVAPENEATIRAGSIPYQIINSNEMESVNINYEQLGYRATEALIKKHHTNIACLLSKGTRTQAFFKGYKKCLFDHNINLNDEFIIELNDNYPESLLMGKISGHKISGLVISHYAAAIKIYESLNRLHYNTPYDVSIVSLKDDTRIKSDYPPISTFTIPHYDFGKLVTKYLIDVIEKKESAPISTASSELFDIPVEIDNEFSIDIPFLSRSKKIVVVGSVNIDNYLNFDTLPHTGKTVSTPSASLHPGGKCLNEALGVARLGHNAAIIANVGNDADADIIYDLVKEYSIDTVGLKRCQGCQTGQAYIFVQKDGDSMISIILGANNTLDTSCITDNERLFSNASYCLLQTEVPLSAIIEACRTSKRHGMRTVLKPSTCSELPNELLRMTDIIVPNLDELNELCPVPETMEEKADFLLSCGIGTVIVTLGAAGCYIKSREYDCECSLPAVDFVSVDSSGAGDAFISALVSYMLYGYDLVAAAKIATYAAGFSITRQGVTSALIDKDTLEAYIKQKEPELLL